MLASCPRRFPAPDMEHNQYHHGGGRHQFRVACMREIERQAAEAWSPKRRMQPYVQAAWDFLTVSIPPNEPRPAVGMDVDFSLRAAAAVGMPVDVAAAPSSYKGKARNMADDSGDFDKSVEMSMTASEDEDERGVVFAAANASTTGPRGYGDRNVPGGSGQQRTVDGDSSDRKRRAPASDGSPRGGFGSERAWGGGRGRGGEHRRGSSTGSGGGRDGQSRYQDRGRKPRTSDHGRSGRGGSVS